MASGGRQIRLGRALLALAALAGAFVPAPASADTPSMHWLSRPLPGAVNDGHSGESWHLDRYELPPMAVSRDGRYVAFLSQSRQLIPGDSNGGAVDVFRRDVLTGETVLVSVGPGGEQSSRHSANPAMSADGRFIAFSTGAENWGFPELISRVWLRDVVAGTTTLISVTPTGEQLRANAERPLISPDGRYVFFSSAASNLPDATGHVSTYVLDRASGALTRVPAFTRTGAPFPMKALSVSDDTRLLTFESTLPDLVEGPYVRRSCDTYDNPCLDAYVIDRFTGVITRVSATDGVPHGNYASGRPVISPDGRFVAYVSSSTNLTDPPAANLCPLPPQCLDAFLHDLETRTNTYVSEVDDQAGWNSVTSTTAVDRFACSVAYDTPNRATFGPRDNQVAVWRRLAGTNEIVSTTQSGSRGNGGSIRPALSPTGRYVAFATRSTDIVAGAGGTFFDAMLRDNGYGAAVPPRIETPPDRVASVGVESTWGIAACDDAGEALSWSATGLPPGASLDSSTGMLRWTPPAGLEGTSYRVTFTVRDASGATASAEGRLRVARPVVVGGDYQRTAFAKEERPDLTWAGTRAEVSGDVRTGAIDARAIASSNFATGVRLPAGVSAGAADAGAAARILHDVDLPSEGTYRVRIRIAIDDARVIRRLTGAGINNGTVSGAAIVVAKVAHRPCASFVACAPTTDPTGSWTRVQTLVLYPSPSTFAGTVSFIGSIRSPSGGTISIDAGVYTSASASGRWEMEAATRGRVELIEVV